MYIIFQKIYNGCLDHMITETNMIHKGKDGINLNWLSWKIKQKFTKNSPIIHRKFTKNSLRLMFTQFCSYQYLFDGYASSAALQLDNAEDNRILGSIMEQSQNIIESE